MLEGRTCFIGTEIGRRNKTIQLALVDELLKLLLLKELGNSNLLAKDSAYSDNKQPCIPFSLAPETFTSTVACYVLKALIRNLLSGLTPC